MAHEWYVIQTLSGQEQKVEKSLAKRIGDEEMGEYIKEVLVPMEKVVEVRGGKKTTTQRKLYPGYRGISQAALAASSFGLSSLISSPRDPGTAPEQMPCENHSRF